VTGTVTGFGDWPLIADSDSEDNRDVGPKGFELEDGDEGTGGGVSRVLLLDAGGVGAVLTAAAGRTLDPASLLIPGPDSEGVRPLWRSLIWSTIESAGRAAVTSDFVAKTNEASVVVAAAGMNWELTLFQLRQEPGIKKANYFTEKRSGRRR